MANLGIGLGAFMQGVTQGAEAYANIKRMGSEGELRDMQIADIKQQRQDKENIRNITTQGAAAAQTNTDGQLDNVVNYFQQKTLPQIVQHYLSTGEVDKANALQKWGSDASVMQGAKYGVGMMRAAAVKDLDGVGRYMVQAYNQPNYFEDGNTATGYNVIRDKDGNQTGLEIMLKNKDGKESTHKFNSVDEVYKIAQTFGNPLAVFNAGMQAYQTQQANAQKNQAEIAKEQREWNRDTTKLGLVQQNTLEAQNNKAELDRAAEADKRRNGGDSNKVKDAQAVAALLKAQGYSDDYVRQNMPALVGIQNQTRPRASRIEDYIKINTENNRDFRKLPSDQQIAKANEFIDMVDKQASGSGAAPTAGVGLPARTQGGQTTPVVSGQTPAVQGGQGKTPFYDTRTNSIIYR